jgi:hypothetical protein
VSAGKKKPATPTSEAPAAPPANPMSERADAMDRDRRALLTREASAWRAKRVFGPAHEVGLRDLIGACVASDDASSPLHLATMGLRVLAADLDTLHAAQFTESGLEPEPVVIFRLALRARAIAEMAERWQETETLEMSEQATDNAEAAQ